MDVQWQAAIIVIGFVVYISFMIWILKNQGKKGTFKFAQKKFNFHKKSNIVKKQKFAFKTFRDNNNRKEEVPL